MFDVKAFSNILQKITDTYTSISEFSEKSEVNRTYISKYINMKLDNPPTPKILQKLADFSHGIVSYSKLMYVCGYLNKERTEEKLMDKYNLSKDDWEYIKPRIEKIDYLSNVEREFLSDLLLKYASCKNKETFNVENSINNNLSNEQKANIRKAFESCQAEIQNSCMRYTQKFYMCPVYGQISAGQPNWAEECIEGRIPIDPSLMDIINPEECFFLRINGESMNKIVSNGSYALIRKTDWVENGEIAVVLVNEFDATLKKFSKQGDLVVLEPMSNDNSFQVQIYDKNTPVEVIGKYIGKFEMKQ